MSLPPYPLCFLSKNKDKLVKLKVDIFKYLGKLQQNANEWLHCISILLSIWKILEAKKGNCQQISVVLVEVVPDYL